MVERAQVEQAEGRTGARRTTRPDRSSDPRYWPVFDLATNRVVGVDLAAAPRPVRAVDDPRRPVEVALRAAGADVARAGMPAQHWWVGLAVSAQEAVSIGTVAAISRGLDDGGLEAHRVVLRMTEEALAAAAEAGTAERIARLGVRFALADFGAGTLSPSVLRRLPVGFVRVSLRGLQASDHMDVSLLRSVAAVAASLQVQVLGTEVEVDDQVALADDAGLDLVQGYRWGSAGLVEKLVATWARTAPSA